MMNRLFFFTIVISSIIFPNSLFSQSFRGGFKGGLVASEVSGDNLAGPDKFGFFGSAFTFLPVSQFSYIQSEVMFIQKGSRANPKEENLYRDYLLALNYVEIPFMYVQKAEAFTRNAHVKEILFNGGLSVSTLVSHKEEENGFDISNPERDSFYAAELNLLLGISYPITNSLYFTFGYSNSITPIRPHASKTKKWNNYGQYSSIWTLGLSFIAW